MREVRTGGDGLSWTSRNKKYMWRRLDFLVGHEFAEDYLTHKMFLWKIATELGFPAPDLVRHRNGSYFSRQPWIKASEATPSLWHIYNSILQLESLAQKGLAHGDLSPEHLVVSGKNVCWIDWMACTILGGIGYRGKQYYISPERDVSGVVTESSEIFALGKILQDWVTVDPRLTSIAERATAQDQKNRYSSFAVMRADLSLLLEHSPV